MIQVLSKTLTLTEFLQLPETKPASEYIDGQICLKPMPQGKHSTIQGELVSTINAVVKPKRIARAFPELRCIFGDRAIVPARVNEEIGEQFFAPSTVAFLQQIILDGQAPKRVIQTPVYSYAA